MAPRYTLGEVLQDVWWVGLVAFAVSLTVTPIVRFAAYRAGIVDRPDDLLKPHGRPVAYLGGLAMCLGLLAGLGGYVAVMPGLASHWEGLREGISRGSVVVLLANPLWNVLAVALACMAITLVGLLDDIRELRPMKKVLGQLLAAAILLGGGIGHRMAMVLLIPLHLNLPAWIVVPLSAAMCAIVVVATCNAANLLDGMDGLCGGVTGIIALGFLALAVFLAVWGHYPDTGNLRIGLCLAMAGAVLGFLPYNVPPASIFMGDAGSMLLGLFVATMMALFCREGNVRWFIAACGVFALPILDTALAVVRRIRSGRSIFAGDRSHLYDQLMDRGMGVKQVVGLFYLLAFMASVIGVVTAVFIRARYAVAMYAVLLAVIWTIFYAKGMISPAPRR